MKAILKKNEEIDVLNGFPWIYSNEVSNLIGELDTSQTVEVLDYNNNFIGFGYINLNSKILIRMLTLKKEALDSAFFERRIKDAVEHRIKLGIYNACRLVFSEGDYLPGLIVDKYEDYLVVQLETKGMDVRRDLIISLLNKIIKPKGILERSISPSRKKEGLSDVIKEYGLIPEEIIITENNNIKYSIDVKNGQKTGHFFDQRYNRLKAADYTTNSDVLDLCCNTGGFTLNILKKHPKSITSVDISEKVLDKLKRNIELNNLENEDITIINQDMFEFLEQNDKLYDFIVLDPPALLKNKDKINQAYAGYVKANTMALIHLKPNGYLMTFSCSGLLTLDLFLKMLEDVKIKAKKKITIVDLHIQAPDHPIILPKYENLYLKSAILKVNE